MVSEFSRLINSSFPVVKKGDPLTQKEKDAMNVTNIDITALSVEIIKAQSERERQLREESERASGAQRSFNLR